MVVGVVVVLVVVGVEELVVVFASSNERAGHRAVRVHSELPHELGLATAGAARRTGASPHTWLSNGRPGRTHTHEQNGEEVVSVARAFEGRLQEAGEEERDNNVRVFLF